MIRSSLPTVRLQQIGFAGPAAWFPASIGATSLKAFRVVLMLKMKMSPERKVKISDATRQFPKK